MLAQLIADFIDYTEHVNFKERSRQAVKSRLKQLTDYCEYHNIQDVKDITFQQLLQFITEFGHDSVHVKKKKQNMVTAPVLPFSHTEKGDSTTYRLNIPVPQSRKKRTNLPDHG